jgi:predicted TIM-barrel fold metal-dependent hydrolase
MARPVLLHVEADSGAGVGERARQAERVLFGSDFPLNLYPRLDAEPNLARFVAEAHRGAVNAGQLLNVLRDSAARIIRG